MPHYYVNYRIKDHLESVWSKNQQFWLAKKAKMKEETELKHPLHKKAVFKHGTTMHIYGFSAGEDYFFEAGYDRETQTTYMLITVKWTLFGKGAIWLIPKEILAEWAKYMGLQELVLQSKKTPDFLLDLEKITQIDQLPMNEEVMRYCPHCGEKIGEYTKFCPECGMDFQLHAHAQKV